MSEVEVEVKTMERKVPIKRRVGRPRKYAPDKKSEQQTNILLTVQKKRHINKVMRHLEEIYHSDTTDKRKGELRRMIQRVFDKKKITVNDIPNSVINGYKQATVEEVLNEFQSQLEQEITKQIAIATAHMNKVVKDAVNRINNPPPTYKKVYYNDQVDALPVTMSGVPRVLVDSDSESE